MSSPTSHLSIRIPAGLRAQIAHIAQIRGETLTDLVVSAMRQWVSQELESMAVGMVDDSGTQKGD